MTRFNSAISFRIHWPQSNLPASLFIRVFLPCICLLRFSNICAGAGPSSSPCKLYLARSTVNDQNFAYFSGVDLPASTPVASYSDLAVPVFDIWVHQGLIKDNPDDSDSTEGSKNTTKAEEADQEADQVWSATWTSDESFAQFEDSMKEEGMSMITGIGVVGTHHAGIVNVKWNATELYESHRSGARPGFMKHLDGGQTPYHGMKVYTKEYVRAGTELFMDFGDEWVEMDNAMHPSQVKRANYKKADAILRNFTALVEEYTDFFAQVDANKTEAKEELWKLIREDAIVSRVTKMLLPENMTDVERATEIGTGIFHNDHVMPSLDKLEKEGICMDGAVIAPSTIHEAGQGAFSTRSYDADERVTATPVLRIHRDQLAMYELLDVTEDDKKSKFRAGAKRKPKDAHQIGEQLLVNYCFGDEDSNVLLFPTSSVVASINHASTVATDKGKARETSNVRLEWSSWDQNQLAWRFVSPENLAAVPTMGLVVDLVATRPIAPGDELFLDYGPNWSKAWKEYHTRRGKMPSMVDAAQQMNIAYVNKQLLSEEELLVSPYPDSVMTVCRFEPKDYFRFEAEQKAKEKQEGEAPGTSPVSELESLEDKEENSLEESVPLFEWKEPSRIISLCPCSVVALNTTASTTERHYIVRMDVQSKSPYSESNNKKKSTADNSSPDTQDIVTISNVPQRAISFVNKPYTSALHRHLEAPLFRHPIDFPRNTFPDTWRRKNIT